MLRIDEMYAFITVHEDGEALIGIPTADGGMVPMVGADMARMDSLAELVQIVSDKTGANVELVKFSKRTLLKTITPGNPAGAGTSPTKRHS